MKRIFLPLLFVLVFALFVTEAAYAQDGNPQDAGNATVQVAVLLAPLVAAATAVERLVEMIFDWYESAILNLSKFPAQASDYLGWARKEVEKYKNELLIPRQEGEKDVELAARLRRAEENLLKAQDRLHEYLSSPTYLSQKKKISLILAIAFGLIIALSARVKMFSLLGISVSEELAVVDMVITGLVIGTGSAPVHSLIGIIQNTKDAVDGARALWQGKATADVQRILMEMYAASQPAPMAAPAPLAGIAGMPEAATAQPPEQPELSALDMDRMVKRILRK